jgi:hypothetical protein
MEALIIILLVLLFFFVEYCKNVPDDILYSILIIVIMGGLAFLAIWAPLRWGSSIKEFLRSSHTLLLPWGQSNIRGWLIVLCFTSGIIGLLIGLLGNFEYQLNIGGKILSGLIAGIFGLMLPVVGPIFYASSYGRLIEIWIKHSDENFQRWEREQDRLIETGLAIGKYRCMVCGKSVTKEDVDKNTCSHCNAHWNRRLWENPPPRPISGQTAATLVWAAPTVGVFFGIFGAIVAFIVLISFTVCAVRDTRQWWHVWPLWCGSIALFITCWQFFFPLLHLWP